MSNREIKFRVWEFASNKFIYDMDWLFKNPSVIPSKIFNREDNTLLIQQFTGLKDINGVEIYEGDIIKYDPFNDRDYKNFVCIVYNLDEFHWWSDLKNMLYEFKNKCNIQVIGNIFENPELLK